MTPPMSHRFLTALLPIFAFVFVDATTARNTKHSLGAMCCRAARVAIVPTIAELGNRGKQQHSSEAESNKHKSWKRFAEYHPLISFKMQFILSWIHFDIYQYLFIWQCFNIFNGIHPQKAYLKPMKSSLTQRFALPFQDAKRWRPLRRARLASWWRAFWGQRLGSEAGSQRARARLKEGRSTFSKRDLKGKKDLLKYHRALG